MLQSVLSAGDGLIDRLLCVAGAVLCSQLPEFIQQYVQRLGGHLDEARRQLAQFGEIAKRSGLTLEQLMAKSQDSSEATVASMGQLMHGTVARVNALSAADAALRGASIFSRPFVFLRHVDLPIARATWGAFKPAVPTTAEGMLYAIFGVLLIMVLYHGAVRYPARRAWRRREERQAAEGRDRKPAPAPHQEDGDPRSGNA
jgi:hypothetical protein